MLRQALNQVEIVGPLAEMDLSYGSFKDKQTGVERKYIRGTLHVLIEKEEGETQTVPVSVFSAVGKEGQPTASYESIEAAKKNFISIAASGSPNMATWVYVKGEIRPYEYINRNGKLVSDLRLEARFVNEAKYKDQTRSSFICEFYLNSMYQEEDKLVVEGVLPLWGERVSEVTMVAYNPNVIAAIEAYWKPQGSYKANGILNFDRKVERVKEEMGFGTGVEKIKTTVLNELVLTGGTTEPLEDDFAFSPNDIKVAMAERQIRLEKDQKEYLAKEQSKKPATGSSSPFGF